MPSYVVRLYQEWRVVLYLDFYDCNMCFFFFFGKDNVFTIDFWWCNEKVFSALHCYLMVLHCYFQC